MGKLQNPSATNGGKFFRADQGNVGLRAIKTDTVEVDVGFGGAFGSNSNDIDARKGLPDLGALVEFGPRVKWKLGEASDTGRLRAEVALRGVFDLTDGFRDKGLTLEHESHPWRVQPTSQVHWFDKTRAPPSASGSPMFWPNPLPHPMTDGLRNRIEGREGRGGRFNLATSVESGRKLRLSQECGAILTVRGLMGTSTFLSLFRETLQIDIPVAPNFTAPASRPKSCSYPFFLRVPVRSGRFAAIICRSGIRASNRRRGLSSMVQHVLRIAFIRHEDSRQRRFYGRSSDEERRNRLRNVCRHAEPRCRHSRSQRPCQSGHSQRNEKRHGRSIARKPGFGESTEEGWLHPCRFKDGRRRRRGGNVAIHGQTLTIAARV